MGVPDLSQKVLTTLNKINLVNRFKSKRVSVDIEAAAKIGSELVAHYAVR